ncbi:uncharacterized protein LOC143289306 [Babylonia areolata]|uniref:uncharacterized protein LOC143289306 n=1 Tax=Babylonia areolata TaxID=304850 RepID=UPI003FD2131B
MKRLQTVLIPFICVLGVIGNVLAAGAFFSPNLSNTFCCFHLASKSLNDIGFLVSLFVIWLHRLGVMLFATPGVCQVTVFLTYVCGCLSVWFVVCITVENFIRFTKPRLISKYCTVGVAKRMVGGALLVTALLYNCSLWTSGVEVGPDGSRHCNSLTRFADIVMATTIIDTALTLIVPSILMFFVILAIIFKSMESFERKKRLARGTSSCRRERQKKRLTPEGKMTTFLFALSVIFLLLNLPTHVIRLKMLIHVYVQQRMLSYSDVTLQRFSELLLYLNFSTNCLIYLLFGERFRAEFKGLYLRRCFPPSTGMGQRFASYSADVDESVCLTCITESSESPASTVDSTTRREVCDHGD